LATAPFSLIIAIRDTLGDEQPVMINLDTLNRSLRGSESSDEDMTAYIRATDAIREAFDCTVVIVHHCGIDGTRPRGHTLPDQGAVKSRRSPSCG
jgi:RecA-family ATPase